MSSTETAGQQELPGTRKNARRWPTVSVVIPTRDRAAMLADTLKCLAAQDYPADLLEIIVVDNSSADGTEEIVQRLQATYPLALHYTRKENQGPASARNHGVNLATGEIVAFTDSDCQMGRDWIRNAVRCMVASRAGLVSGPVRPWVNPSRAPGFFSHQIDHSRPNSIYPTSNVLYRRASFQGVGGFDVQFGTYSWGPPVGGEDTDLAWRVRRAGHVAVFAEDAPVFHEASSIGPVAWLLEPVRLQIMPFLVNRFPELRRWQLWNRYFLDRYTAAFDIAIVGLIMALLRRRPLVAGLTLPWIWLHRGWVRQDVWPPSRWWRVPIKYSMLGVRSLVLAIVLLGASLRHRTLVT